MIHAPDSDTDRRTNQSDIIKYMFYNCSENLNVFLFWLSYCFQYIPLCGEYLPYGS